MFAILSLVQQLLGVGAGRKNSYISGINLNVTGIAAFMLAMATTVVSVVLLMMALQGWLATAIASPYAVPLSWLCCALVTLAVAGTSMLVAKSTKENRGLVSLAYAPLEPLYHERPHAGSNGSMHPGPESKAASNETFIQNMAKDLSAKIEEYPLSAVILAGLAGMAAGKSMEE